MILVGAGIAAPLTGASALVSTIAFAAALAGEILGRYLFFVSVVPKSIASTFTSNGRRAA